MKSPPLGPGEEDNILPDQVAPRGRKASSTRNLKPQTSKFSGCRDPLSEPSYLTCRLSEGVFNLCVCAN